MGLWSHCWLQVYSLDYARTRLANDAADGNHNRQFTGLWSVYKKTYASDGIAGLYRGFNVSVVSSLVRSAADGGP